MGQLAEAVGCSKAYLSGIENRRVAPPRRHLLVALERAMEAPEGELLRLAEWQTTPAAVQADYRRLAEQLQDLAGRRGDGSVNLDALYRSGALHHQVADAAATRDLEPVALARSGVPLINKVAAGYPADFTDLDYPAKVADEYINCPDVGDPQAFAARVVGGSMLPEYREGDVIVFSPARCAADGLDCFVRLLPDHASTFKRVFFEGEDRIRLQPLNPAFDPRVVDRREVDGLYPAVYRIQPIGLR